MKINLIKGDCLEEMEYLRKKNIKIKAGIFDLPYGTTKCKWDSIIDLKKMWNLLSQISNNDSIYIFTACQPFTTNLIMSNPKMFKYSLVYQKTTPTGHYNAKIMPLRTHEDILIFYKKPPTYNPQKTKGHKRKSSSAESKKKSSIRAINKDKVYGNEIIENITDYDSTERYPTSVLKFSTDKQKSNLHPTQKPIALMEYLIKTYTNENDLVLDITMGSGTTGMACKNLNRNFIGIELDENYFNIAKDRINNS